MRALKAEDRLIQPNKRVTLQDLALELGLSSRAVSQALNEGLNPGGSNVRLSPKTIERIQKLAAQRNYLRDSRARSMRYGRFFNIGYFEASKKTTGWPLLGAMSGVCDAASAHNYHILLIRLSSESTGEPSLIPTVFRESNLDALIISNAGNLTEKLEKVIDASGFPVVYLNENKSHNAVYVDEIHGAEEITRYLIALGNQKIVYFSGITDSTHYSHTDRKRGYMMAMEQADLEPKVVPTIQNGDVEFMAWMDANKDVEAIVCYNDLCAIDALRLLSHSPFIVPANLALTGFGDDFAILQKLTTMRSPFYAMGKAAVEMTLELVNGKHKKIPSRRFSQDLVVRDSTRNRLSEQSGSTPIR